MICVRLENEETGQWNHTVRPLHQINNPLSDARATEHTFMEFVG